MTPNVYNLYKKKPEKTSMYMRKKETKGNNIKDI